MSCEIKTSLEAQEFEQLKSLRNLNNIGFLVEVKDAKEQQEKILALDFDIRKSSINLALAGSIRESYDERFRIARKIQSIDFSAQKAKRNLEIA